MEFPPPDIFIYVHLPAKVLSEAGLLQILPHVSLELKIRTFTHTYSASTSKSSEHNLNFLYDIREVMETSC